MSTEEIIKAVEDQVSLEGSENAEWFIGTTDDVERALFTDHGLVEEKNWWVGKEAGSADDARAVLKHFADKKMDGGEDGGDDALHVFAFRKAEKTKPAGVARKQTA